MKDMYSMFRKLSLIPEYVCDPDLKPRAAQLMNLKTIKGDRINIIKSTAPVWKDVGLLMDLDSE